jgi:phosphatidylinositol alpha-1,6-mannosyltransferase
MRVLVLVTDAFGEYGGIAKFNQDLLRALCAHPTCQEVVVVPRRVTNPMGPLPSRLAYVTSSLDGKVNYVLAASKVVRRNPNFGLIVCGHINLLPVAFLLRLWVQAPIVLIVHGRDAWEPTTRPLTNYLAGRVDAFISVSELTKQWFLRWAKLSEERGFLLPNAIELEHFGPGPANPALINRYGLASKTVLMTLGRLSSEDRYKGFDEVLESLPILAEEIPDVAYLIVGEGTDRRRLEEKARSLGVDGRLVFAGLVPEAQKADHYRLARAFVMPGRGEGFGIVYLEALACGVPVVASKVDGSREAVRDGDWGILVDPNDQEEIVAGILEALRRPTGVVPEGLHHFSYEKFEQRLHRIVDRVYCERQQESMEP